MKKQKSTITRSEFLNTLASLTKEEMVQIILSKGKEPKSIKPFIIIK